MSRLASLSPAALKAMFAPESDDTLITLTTISGTGIAQPIRLADGYTHKFEYLSATQMTVTEIETQAGTTFTFAATDAVVKDALAADRNEAFYGVMSNGRPYLFIPMQISLPTETASEAPTCSLTIYDVTRQLTPIIRSINSAPSVEMTLVLSQTPDAVEASFPGFLLGAIKYDADSVSGSLTVESYVAEPFPCHTMTPSYFPGMF